MNNYEYCTQWLVSNQPASSAKSLDYGCGSGAIVKSLRTVGCDAYGCDMFYEGGDCSALVEKSLFEQGIIRRMEAHRIPFDDEYFDLIVNNQVMEHVEDLDIVLREIARVLKPGGVVLNLFPDRGVWREGHCGIPFLHWFPKGSKFRVYYAAVLRGFGLGYHKKDKDILTWSRDFCDWLDKWTFYRGRSELKATYGRYFESITHIEEHWFVSRFSKRIPGLKSCPTQILRFAAHKLAGLVFTVRKHGAPLNSTRPAATGS